MIAQIVDCGRDLANFNTLIIDFIDVVARIFHQIILGLLFQQPILVIGGVQVLIGEQFAYFTAKT